MSDPATIFAYKGFACPFALRVLIGGVKVNLPTASIYIAGIEHEVLTSFKRFRLTSHGTSGVLSGTIPSSMFTGAATMRVWKSGSPRTLVVDRVKVKTQELSSNWLTG